MIKKIKKIAFQGTYGAYSDLVCRKFYKSYQTHPCLTFEQTLLSVSSGEVELAMIPVENSIAGKVTDMHILLENTNLKIIAEHYHRIKHYLLGKKNVKLNDLKNVYSHIHALSQCKKSINKLGLNSINFIDTAGAAEFISRSKNISDSAVASELAAKIYNLKVFKKNLEDEMNNVTRFLVFSKNSVKIGSRKKVITTLIFKTKNLPASLYKALGGFATNGINLTRLENFFMNKNFDQSSFLIDVESHPETESFLHAVKELRYYASNVKILGYYIASKYRSKIN